MQSVDDAVFLEMGVGGRASSKEHRKTMRDQYQAASARKVQRSAEQERDRKLLEIERLKEYIRANNEGKEADTETTMSTRQEIAMYKEKYEAKKAMMAKVLKKNQELRKRVEELRKSQLGMDEEIWDAIAPNKKHKGLFTENIAEVKTTKDKQLLNLGKKQVEEEQLRAKQLQGEAKHYESMVTRETRARELLEEKNSRLTNESVTLKKAISDRLRDKKRLMQWREKHERRLVEVERKFRAQIDREVAAYLQQLEKDNAEDIRTAYTEQWEKQQRELEREAQTLKNRLDVYLKEAVVINDEVTNLKHEINRINRWGAEDLDVDGDANEGHGTSLQLLEKDDGKREQAETTEKGSESKKSTGEVVSDGGSKGAGKAGTGKQNGNEGKKEAGAKSTDKKSGDAQTASEKNEDGSAKADPGDAGEKATEPGSVDEKTTKEKGSSEAGKATESATEKGSSGDGKATAGEEGKESGGKPTEGDASSDAKPTKSEVAVSANVNSETK